MFGLGLESCALDSTSVCLKAVMAVDNNMYNVQLHTVPKMETCRVDLPVRLPVGSRLFDRSVKPVETAVKFFFVATKRHLSTNRNIYIYIYILVHK